MDIKESNNYLDYVMQRFYTIGSDDSGGVTRLSYTKEEDQMHEEFRKMGEEEGFIVETDDVGNTFLSLKKYSEYYLIGSHLDSVINGGRFDGVLGVASGLLLLKIIKENNLNIPVKVAAFRCEESSNFMKSTLGSGLITGEYLFENFHMLKSIDGKTIEKIFDERGYNKKPNVIQGIKEYLEIHIEQGRVLESKGLRIGIVSAIAGNMRLKISVIGLAEHSGATPMNLRRDALCAASEIILGVEKVGQGDFTNNAVATIGAIENHPNSVNVIPGKVVLNVDIRDVSINTMEEMKLSIEKLVKNICYNRKVEYEMELISSSKGVQMNDDIKNKLCRICDNMNLKYIIMQSGAGHDAMKFANITKCGMIFIPCKDGISHNPKEDANINDAVDACMIILEYLKSEILNKE